MSTVSAQNALKLSAWIYTQHPQLFRALLSRAQALQRSPLGRLGMFGDDSSLSDVTSTIDVTNTPVDTIDTSTPGVDLSSFTPDLSTVSLDTSTIGGDLSSSVTDPIAAAVAAPPPAASTPADTSSSSGGFWSGIGSAASGAGAAIASVAKLAVAALPAVAVGAGAYFSAQSKTAVAQSQAQTQQAILQAQMARVAQGYAPAPISYVTNPVTGQVTPVYSSNAGMQPVTGSLLSALSTPTASGLSLGTILIGGGLLFLVAVVATRPRK
jgi:hypothetical protein